MLKFSINFFLFKNIKMTRIVITVTNLSVVLNIFTILNIEKYVIFILFKIQVIQDNIKKYRKWKNTGRYTKCRTAGSTEMPIQKGDDNKGYGIYPVDKKLSPLFLNTGNYLQDGGY